VVNLGFSAESKFLVIFVSIGCPLKGQPHTNCRLKRHLISTPNHEHGRPAETKPDSTLLAQVLDFQKIMQAFRKNGMLKHV
jgi:hypothetical protein